MYVVLPLILKVVTLVGAARINSDGLLLNMAISWSVVDRTVIRYNLPVSASSLILIRGRGGAKARLDLPVVINYNIIDITLTWL